MNQEAPEILTIDLGNDITAVLAITIINPPSMPTPLEPETRTVPTARQLAEISRKLSKGQFTFD